MVIEVDRKRQRANEENNMHINGNIRMVQSASTSGGIEGMVITEAMTQENNNQNLLSAGPSKQACRKQCVS